MQNKLYKELKRQEREQRKNAKKEYKQLLKEVALSYDLTVRQLKKNDNILISYDD